MGKRNPVAKALRTVVFRPRRTKVTKGKGSYDRKQRHRTVRTDGVFFLCRKSVASDSHGVTNSHISPFKQYGFTQR